MKNKKVLLLESFKKKNAYQFFFDWVENAWVRESGEVKKTHYFLSWKMRILISKLGLVRSFSGFSKKKNPLLVLCGGFPTYYLFPYNYNHEIIPIIWDCWPRYWDRLFLSISQNKIKTIFVTSSQVRDLILDKFPNLNVFWIPEGIEINKYAKGNLLVERSIDLLELGRINSTFHEQIIADISLKAVLKNHLYSKDGTLLFPEFSDLTKGLSDTKITVCFPRCDTHPEMAGNIETLTQRYWECMLSRTLILGRAPKELIDLLGYNPVIDLDFENVATQLEDILLHIDSYQELVDRNYAMAINNSSWDARIKLIQEKLTSLGYQI